MTNNFLKWSATLFTILGAVAVTLRLDPLNIWLLNAGSLLWMIWAYRIREYSIVLVNATMIAIYFGGLFIRL